MYNVDPSEIRYLLVLHRVFFPDLSRNKPVHNPLNLHQNPFVLKRDLTLRQCFVRIKIKIRRVIYSRSFSLLISFVVISITGPTPL